MLVMRLLGLSPYRSKQDAKHTGAEEGEVGVRGHGVLAGTDRGLGSSGLFFGFPQSGNLQPRGSRQHPARGL